MHAYASTCPGWYPRLASYETPSQNWAKTEHVWLRGTEFRVLALKQGWKPIAGIGGQNQGNQRDCTRGRGATLLETMFGISYAGLPGYGVRSSPDLATISI
eukprot:3198276-Rhodomonas_salina.1